MQEMLIYQLFEKQVLNTPDNIAIEFDDISLTYLELNNLANQLANHIKKNLAIENNNYIALYLDRTEQMVVAILAIFKAGCIYVPFDTNFPDNRLEYMLNDVNPALVITNVHYQSKLQSLLNIPNKSNNQKPQDFNKSIILAIDSEISKSQIATLPKENLNIPRNLSNLAYVIYTSGTTGHPKGILHIHRSLTDRILWLIDSHKISSDFVVIGKTPYCYDPSLREIFVPLLVGAKLVLMPQDTHKDMNKLINYINKYAVNMALFVPSQMQVFLQLLRDEYSDLINTINFKVIYSVGEKLTVSLAKNILEMFPNVRLYNQYGSSESCMIQLEYLVDKEDLFAKEIPIGYSYQNVYILDRLLKPVKVNEIGELYVGGNALSIGYLNNPKLTSEKFIANHFCTTTLQNDKLYKSGDLVKLLPNDKLEYVGRDDFQIKLRGNRIEPSEIEYYINKYPLVEQSVVVFKTSLSDTGEITNAYLIGYYVSKSKLDEAEILNHLRQMLPDYMIPNILIHIDRLPLNINGKLDRSALPPLESLYSNNYHPAQNIFESETIDILADLLGIPPEKISFTDDFFRLGGNSLLVIRLVAKLNHKFKSNLKTQDIYQLKTINKIYNLMQESLGQFCYDEYQINGIDEDNLYKPFPLTNVQQAYYLGRFDNFSLGNVATHDYIEYKFNYLDVDLLQKTFNQLLERHLALRTVFVDNQQLYLATVPEYKITLYNESERLSIRNTLSHKVYNPSNYPLFDICVSISDSSQYLLHISYDALLMDANSFKILFKEWTSLYNESTHVLDKPNITYRDYILKFNQVKASNLLIQAKNYWLNKLDSYNFNMPLPLINKDSAIQKPTFKRITKTIANDIWNKIVSKSHNYGISPSIVIIAAYGQVLSHWANQKNVCINLTLFNRLPLHEDVNDVIGDFTVLELFNYHSDMKTVIRKVLNEIHSNLWHDIENNLFDGIDFQRLIRKQYQLSDNEVIAPVVLTCLFGMKTAQDDEAFLDHSYQGINYSITQTSQVWLDHKAYENKDGLVAEWDYVEQLFNPNIIEQMHSDYCNLIELFAFANWEMDKLPQINLSKEDISLIESCNIATQERSNDTLFSRCESIIATHELDLSIAVIDDNTKNEYNYKQLLSDGLFLAKYLLWYKQRFNPDQGHNSKLIGILCEKSYSQVIATYSIMKSGHGYLPLNIDWPIGRFEEILEEGNISLVLISRSEYNKKDVVASLSSKYHLLVIEDILLEIFSSTNTINQLNHIKLPIVMPNDIAYVIFTSGSTGRPKGVTISHNGAINTIDAVNHKFKVTSNDSILAISDLSFDLSVYDIFGLLFVGGTIIFPKQSKIKDQSYWVEVVNNYKITLWNSVPQLTELLINEAKITAISINSLRLFLMSGDFISVNLPSKIKELIPHTMVISLGGATEGSIWSIWYEIIEVPSQWNRIPYGIAMPNQKMYILNYNLKHCPVGVLGDIYIGGDGVAINYWQDEAKTSASFIDHESLGRLYKTGDIGYWSKNGYMEFMGRSDNQVKINGYRIELEEINNNLLKIPGVRDSVVVHQKSGDYLVGYLVLDNNKIPTAPKDVNLQFSIEEFKLKQYGILNGLSPTYKLDVHLDEVLFRLNKSYRNFTDEYIPITSLPDINKDICQLVNYKNKGNTSTKILTQVLSKISGLFLSDKVLPKYLYPSGGSSYSIRCFINIASPIESINRGYYYYNPINHELCISDNPDVNLKDSENELHLIVHLPAIKPLYGDLSLNLAYIEIGHMLCLLCEELDKSGISYHVVIDVHEIDSDNILVAKIVLIPTSKIQQTPLQISVKYLEYNKSSNSYTDINGNTKIQLSNNLIDSVSELNQLLSSSKILAVFEADPSVNNLVYSGVAAQKLMSALYPNNIAGCSLGYFPYNGVIYSLALGKIDNNERILAQSNLDTKDYKTVINLELSKTLPNYMLPHDYIILDKLPITANGKIALNQLPELALLKQNIYIAPQNDLEVMLCSAYEDILGLPQNHVGLDDDFFDLGGNSLFGMQLVALINSNLKSKIDLAKLYQYKTVRKICDSNLSLHSDYLSEEVTI